MKTSTLPPGARGFDANARVSSEAADAFLAKGFLFAIRYIPRHEVHDYDLSAGEVPNILGAGLGLMVVQHVGNPGWMPTADLGTEYAGVAVKALGDCGIPAEVTVWCDLEGVNPDAKAEDVIAYLNAWFDVVDAIGYTPGLYVGDSCGLTPDQLHSALKFQFYWSAYNLNAGRFPAVRGVCMRQHAAKPSDFVPGFDNQNMDIDVISPDALGGTPTLLFQ